MQVTYYLDLFFVRGGVIGGVIWGLSIAALAIGIRCLTRITRKRLFPDAVCDSVGSQFEGRRYRDGLKSVEGRTDLFSDLVRRTFAHAHSGREAMEKALFESAEHEAAVLMRRVEWLNVIGSVAPMLGLLGTVWGMIGAFFKIVATGSPDPRLLAGNIGVALVTTLLGLMVAIPSLFLYALLRNRVEEITNDVVLTVNALIAKTHRPRQRPVAAKSSGGDPARGPSPEADPAGARAGE